MARKNTVEITIESKSDAKGAKEAEKGIQNLGDAFEAIQNSAPLAGAAAAAAALSATFEMAKLGATVNTVEDRFTALAGSEQEADKFMRQIRQSTNNTIDSMTAMQGVSRFLSMGLADSADKAAQLTGMAVALGNQTKSASDRIADFGALLANQSTPRLDNFGISSAQVKRRIAELTEAMPGLARETAFTQAVLEIGATSMDRLGDSVNSQQASIDRLGTIVTNTKNAFVSWVADGIVPVLDNSARVFTFAQDVSDALGSHREEVLDSATSWEDYARTQFEALRTSDPLGVNLEKLNNKLRDQGALGEDVVFALEGWNESIDASIELGTGYGEILDKQTFELLQSARAGEFASESYNDMGASMQSAAQDATELTEAIMAGEDRINTYRAALRGALGQEIDQFNAKQSELKRGAKDIQAQIDELNGKRYLTSEQKQELEQLQGQLSDAKHAIQDNADAHEEATRRIVLGFLEQRLAVDGFTEAELVALQRIANQWGLIDDATLDAIEGVNKLAGEFETGEATLDEFVDGASNLATSLERVQPPPFDPMERDLQRMNAGMENAVAEIEAFSEATKEVEGLVPRYEQIADSLIKADQGFRVLSQTELLKKKPLGRLERDLRGFNMELNRVGEEVIGVEDLERTLARLGDDAPPRLEAVAMSMLSVDTGIQTVNQGAQQLDDSLLGVGERGANAIGAMDERFSDARGSIRDSIDATRNLGNQMENLSGRARTAAGNLEGVATAADRIPRDIDIRINVSGDVPSAGMGGAGAGFAGRIDQEFFQAGMTRQVNRPTAFNFVAGEAGSEQVTVAPLEGSHAQAPGGDTFIINNYDSGSARVLRSMVQDRRARRLNSFMGVGA